MVAVNQLVYDLCVGVLILGLLLCFAIPAFTSHADTISLTAKKVDDVEKIKDQSMLGLSRDEVTGSDVISVIRYYSHGPGVSITVTVGGVTRTYTGETYDPGTLNIPYETRFTAAYTYNGKILTGAVYTEKH